MLEKCEEIFSFATVANGVIPLYFNQFKHGVLKNLTIPVREECSYNTGGTDNLGSGPIFFVVLISLAE